MWHNGVCGQWPQESKYANIGISLPGNGERPIAPVYIDGEKDVTLKGDNIAAEFQAIVEDYVANIMPNVANFGIFIIKVSLGCFDELPRL